MKASVHFLACLLGFALIFTTTAHGQNMVSDLDEKFHLEKAISERLEQTLKTRLEKDYFDITVEARLKRKGVNVKVRDHVSAEASSEDIQKWYSSQMRNLSRQMASAEGIDTARPFELESLTVTLGLSDKVETPYREELKTWLTKWVEAGFGSKGEAVVLVRPSNIVQRDLNQPSGLSRYQNLLGMMFMGLVFAGVYLMQSRRNRAVPLATSAVVAVEPQVIQTTPAVTLLPDDAEQKEMIRTLKNKIAWVSPGVKNQIDGLISKWCDSDQPSYLKIAAFLEALAEGGASLNEGARVTVPTIPADAQAALPKALTHLQELEVSATLSLYQEIYSELLSGGSLALKAPPSEFDFLRTLSDEEMLNIFNSGNQSFKISLLTRLPETQRRRYSELITPEELRNLLNYSLICQELSDEELKGMLEQWKVQAGKPATPSLDIKTKFAK
ncbi:MAG: hypothetical protein J7501_18675, partial [Bdellovibrio sp.]|nr:hypothetical protein [Bdellovibrio sp.]